MTHPVLVPVEQALHGLAGVDLGVMPAAELGAVVVGLRRLITGFEAEFARFAHAAEFAEVWRTGGATSMQAWLAAATGATIETARRQVRLADTVTKAPVIGDRMRAGQLSADNAEALATVVDSDHFAGDAEELLEIAAASAPHETRKALELWRSITDPKNEAERDAQARARRHLGFSKGDNGMTDIKGSLPDEDAAYIKTALDHIAGKAFDDTSGRSYPQRIADALTELCKAYAAGTVTGGRERPKLIVTVSYETIVERATGRGVVVGHDVTLSGEAVRRLACDAGLHRLVTKGTSLTLDFGSATRLASDSQYLVLVERDGGCRWPGCHRPPGWCEIHHIDEVIRDDGPTDIANLVLLCSAHHHLVHELRWQLHGNANDLNIQTPDGTILHAPSRRRIHTEHATHTGQGADTDPWADPGGGHCGGEASDDGQQLGFDIAS